MPKQTVRRLLTAVSRAGFTVACAMPLGTPTAFIGAVFAASAATAQAQSATTSAVTGRVQNRTNGRYLNNARVTIVGTNLETFTNEFGEFRLSGVPAGDVKLRVFYSGLDAKEVDLTLEAGQTSSQEISLTNSRLTAGSGEGDTIVLDPIKVSNQREYNAGILAAQEQRFAPNIKSVVSADAFGDVTEGNVGEFVKYLPGVTVDYVAADVRTISVRGFAAQFTNVYQDGLRLVSAASGNLNRIFELEQVSINNASRIEVTKVPTPDVGADALGGSINMVTKNAFERPKAQFKYKAYVSLNHEDLDLSRTPGPGNKRSYKILPGFEFDYTLPVTKNFGLVITGLSSNQFNEQHRSATTWNFAQAGATDENPYLQIYQLQDGPKNTFRDSVSIKADWKVAPGHVLSANLQANYYKSFFGNRNINLGVGTNPAPNTAAGFPNPGTPLSWGPTFTQGASGRSLVTEGTSFRDKLGATKGIFLNYAYTGRDWDWTSAVNYVNSKTWYRDLSRGHFDGVTATLQNVSSLRIDGIDYPAPAQFTVTSPTGAVVDFHNLSNYRINSVTTRPVDGEAAVRTGNFSLKRKFDVNGTPVAVKFGGDVRSEVRDNRRYNSSYTFVGADGVANTADDIATPFLDADYSSQDPYWGFDNIQWVSPYALAELFKTSPGYFQAPSGGGPNERARIQNSERIKETVSAGYALLETRLMQNRLRMVTGVRYEKTKTGGEGALSRPDAVFQRNADGTLVDSDPVAAGVQRVRRADAGTVNSLQEVALTDIERGYTAAKSYNDYYPSLHLTLNITDDLIARFAYARTLGRPDYGDILPRATIDDNDTNPALPGSVVVNNVGLQPWTGDCYDLSLEYYFPKGGVISGGVFQKDLKNFWGTLNGTLTTERAAELGVDPEFAGWAVISKINVGSARVSGMEFNYDQPLTFLPGWGQHFKLSANGTWLHLEGPNGTDFSGFIPKSGNVGLSFSKSPVVVLLKWNYRGRQRNGPVTGAGYRPNTFGYFDSRSSIDANLEYTFSQRFTVFANARNILNQAQDLQRYSPNTAAYARQFNTQEFGIQWAIGVKGSF